MVSVTKEQALNYRKLNTARDFKSSMDSAVAFCLTPIDKYWDMVEYYGESFIDPTGSANKSNWIYVLVNPSFNNICKIGYTTTSVNQRVFEINRSTGLITPWYTVYSYKCPDGRNLEQEIHQYLENRGLRVNPKREGFEIKSEDAIEIINQLGQKYQNI